MNVLDLIRTMILKKQRLNEAQFVMAKAYRGVVYGDARHADPQRSSQSETKQLTYRGQSYQH